MVKQDMPAGHKLAIHINGMRYPIRTQEDPAYVNGLAREIDESVRLMIAGGSSMTDAMVLLCLSYLDNWKKAENNADNLRAQVTQYLEDASKARIELTEVRRELEKLRKLSRDPQMKL